MFTNTNTTSTLPTIIVRDEAVTPSLDWWRAQCPTFVLSTIVDEIGLLERRLRAMPNRCAPLFHARIQRWEALARTLGVLRDVYRCAYGVGG